MTHVNRPRFRIAKRQYCDFKQSPLRHVPLMTAEPPLPISGLSQHDSFYKQMFENNRAVKLVMRQDNGQIVDANPAACQFYGYTYQQITALHITDINILPHAAIKALMNRTVAEKGIIFQTQHRLASGDIRDVEVFSGLIEVDQVAYLYSIIQDITERKHAEKALRESEALYRLFAQNMPDSSVVMFDTDMRHTLAEGPFLKTFGSIYQSAIGKTPQESLPKALADNLIPVYQRALQGESFTDECLTKNFAYESFITPVRGEKGTIIGGMILSHDISKRHSAATALKETETRYQSVINTLSEGIVLQTADGIIQACNAAAEAILGLTADQMMGRTSIDPRWRAIHEDGSPFPGETHPAMVTLQTGLPLTNVIMGVHKPDGTLAWISVNSRPMLRPNEALPYAVVATFVDITERKRLEDDLRTSKNMLMQVIENIPFRIFWKDQHSIYRGCNTRHAIGNGLNSADEIIGKSDYDFLPERAAEWEADDQKIMASGQPRLNVEELIVDVDGSSHWLRSNKVPMRDANGETSGVLIALEDITERKRLEEALRTNEEHLRLITDNITDMILQSDEIGRVVFASPSFHAVLGYEPLTMLGASTTEYIHPDDLAHVGLALQAAIETGRTQLTLEYRARHADGHYLNVETACKILKNDQSQYSGALFVTRDITERKRLEEALRANEQRLRLITNNVQDIVTENDLGGLITYASPSMQTILGYSPDKVLGTSARTLIHPDDFEALGVIFQKAFEDHEHTFYLDLRMRHADGHYIPIETNGTFVNDEQGNIVSSVYVTRDITERKRLEEALRANEQRLRLITDNMADLVTLTDGNRRSTFVSPSFTTLLGYDLAVLENASILEYIHPDDGERIARQVFTARTSGQSGFSTEFRLRHADGHYIEAETVGKFTYAPNGDFIGTVLITRDITERKRFQETLIQHEKLQATLEKEYELSALKSRMMERITHEFRTPLSIIQISAENLLYYYERLTPERREAKMTTIQGQIRRITDMLDEIALVVNGSFIPNKLNLRTVDLSLLCRSLAQELEKQSNTSGKYQLDLPDSINVQLDVPIFDNALLHIMRNAARFSDQLVQVIIKLSHIANTAELQVIDSGIGIPPDELPHIFEPFFRGSNINERGGIGVGLTIARAAIEAHGGTITIDSTLGQGTTVTIRLPA